jgi:hypothetical protein
MGDPFYFGNVEAGADNDLIDYFYVTNTASRLAKSLGHAIPFIYVSRPGAGKTAITKWVEKQDMHVINVTTSGLRMYFEDEENDFNREDYRLLYSFSLLSGVIAEAVKIGLAHKSLKTEYLKYLSANLSNNVYEKFRNEFEGIGVGGVSFSLNRKDRRSFVKDVHRANSLEKAKQYVQEVAKEHTIKLIIDGPEKITSKGFEDTSDENLIRIGCFLSALDVLNECGIGVICFIQEYLLNESKRVYTESGQLASKSKVLLWSEKELLSMLSLRVTNKLHLQWDNVFSTSKERFETTVFPNLINGPRDLLTVCNYAGDKGEIISKEELEKQLDKLLRKKWEQIETEYNPIWSNILPFSKAVLDIVKIKFGGRYFTKDQFFRVYQTDFEQPGTKLNNLRARADWINSLIPPNNLILNCLYTIGLLGYRQDGQKKYAWMGISIDEFEEASEIFVSPLFLREKISPVTKKRKVTRS